MKTLTLDTRFIAPLPKPMWKSMCSHCDKPQANWELTTGDPSAPSKVCLCSLCFLYKSVWAKDRREELDGLISQVEEAKTSERTQGLSEEDAAKVLKFSYEKDPESRLLHASDGDMILASIALTNRTIQLRQKQVTPS